MYDGQIKAVVRKYGITFVYLFGSEAERVKIYFEGGEVTLHPFSDLDIAVTFEKTLPEPMETYGHLYSEISEIFTPFNVDLIFI